MGNLGWTVFLHLKHAKNPLDAVEYIVQDVLSHFLELDSPSDVVEHFSNDDKAVHTNFLCEIAKSLVDAIRTVDFKKQQPEGGAISAAKNCNTPTNCGAADEKRLSCYSQYDDKRLKEHEVFYRRCEQKHGFFQRLLCF